MLTIVSRSEEAQLIQSELIRAPALCAMSCQQLDSAARRLDGRSNGIASYLDQSLCRLCSSKRSLQCCITVKSLVICYRANSREHPPASLSPSSILSRSSFARERLAKCLRVHIAGDVVVARQRNDDQALSTVQKSFITLAHNFPAA